MGPAAVAVAAAHGDIAAAAAQTREKETVMALTRSFRDTVVRHVRDDPAFRAALIEEAYRNILDGDRRTALGQMRDVVNATIGFDALALRTGVQKTSLMRMLSENGNPRAENLLAILKAIGEGTGVRITVHAEAMAAA